MRVLLPPSEGKSAPGTGPCLDVSRLSFPELGPVREALVDALIPICRDQPDAAAKALGLGPSSLGEMAANTVLRTAPCAAAGLVYTGVLYSTLGFDELDEMQRRRLADRVWIASALFGLVGMLDPIPAYRLSGDTRLPGVGSLAARWKSPLEGILGRTDGLLVDLRSGSYVKLGPIPESRLSRTVVPRVLQKMPAGPPKLVTHFNKATKGRLVRALADLQSPPATPESFADWVASTGPDIDLFAPQRSDQPWSMDIVVDQV